MNINDESQIETFNLTSSEAAAILFEKQLALMNKYQAIERLPQWPLDIDNREHQKVIKDFLWRATEELGEFLDAYYEGKNDHAAEELSDILHFHVELLILVEGNPPDFDRVDFSGGQLKSITALSTKYLRCMCKVGNSLKNKPWKQTDVDTDAVVFHLALDKATETLVEMLSVFAKSPGEVVALYSKKNSVNNKRINTGY